MLHRFLLLFLVFFTETCLSINFSVRSESGEFYFIEADESGEFNPLASRLFFNFKFKEAVFNVYISDKTFNDKKSIVDSIKMTDFRDGVIPFSGTIRIPSLDLGIILDRISKVRSDDDSRQINFILFPMNSSVIIDIDDLRAFSWFFEKLKIVRLENKK